MHSHKTSMTLKMIYESAEAEASAMEFLILGSGSNLKLNTATLKQNWNDLFWVFCHVVVTWSLTWFSLFFCHSAWLVCHHGDTSILAYNYQSAFLIRQISSPFGTNRSLLIHVGKVIWTRAHLEALDTFCKMSSALRLFLHQGFLVHFLPGFSWFHSGNWLQYIPSIDSLHPSLSCRSCSSSVLTVHRSSSLLIQGISLMFARAEPTRKATFRV